MHHFTAHRLRFVAEVKETIELNEHQGAAIRGALFHALRNRFCGNRETAECAACPRATDCPVAFLVSTLKPGADRGRDLPRPYTIQPPLPTGDASQPENHRGTTAGHSPLRYEPGQPFTFGLTLFANALRLFPYVVLAVDEFERSGIGRKVRQTDGRYRRGTLAIRQAWAENPITGKRQPVLQPDKRMVQVPDIPITHEQICSRAEAYPPAGPLSFHFLTPTRLIERGRLVKPDAFHFRPFFQRLLERLTALGQYFAGAPFPFDPLALIAAAERVRLVENDLRWIEVRSYSTRQRRATYISGLLGRATFHSDDWSPFLPWLLWGQIVHVGKDAVKGNGLYQVSPPQKERGDLSWPSSDT